jgi:ATP-dependent Lon protease
MTEDKNIREVPVLAMRGSVVFPHTDSFLSFGRTKSVSAINAAFQENRVVAIFNQKDPRIANPGPKDLYEIGTIATITQIMSTEDEIHAMVRGQARIKLLKLTQTNPYLIGKVEEVTELDTKGAEVEAHAKKLSELFKRAVNLGKGVDVQTIMKIISRQADAVELVDSISSLLDITTKQKQQLLETMSVSERIKKVVDLLAHEVNVLDLEQTIADKTQKRFEDQMR